jgi:FG-GAP repeat
LRGSFGVALTSADINGDGLVDLVVGSPGNGKTGRITAFMGSAESPLVAPSPIYVDGPTGSKGFGSSLASSL